MTKPAAHRRTADRAACCSRPAARVGSAGPSSSCAAANGLCCSSRSRPRAARSARRCDRGRPRRRPRSGSRNLLRCSAPRAPTAPRPTRVAYNARWRAGPCGLASRRPRRAAAHGARRARHSRRSTERRRRCTAPPDRRVARAAWHACCRALRGSRGRARDLASASLARGPLARRRRRRARAAAERPKVTLVEMPEAELDVDTTEDLTRI